MRPTFATITLLAICLIAPAAIAADTDWIVTQEQSAVTQPIETIDSTVSPEPTPAPFETTPTEEVRRLAAQVAENAREMRVAAADMKRLAEETRAAVAALRKPEPVKFQAIRFSVSGHE